MEPEAVREMLRRATMGALRKVLWTCHVLLIGICVGWMLTTTSTCEKLSTCYSCVDTRDMLSWFAMVAAIIPAHCYLWYMIGQTRAAEWLFTRLRALPEHEHVEAMREIEMELGLRDRPRQHV